MKILAVSGSLRAGSFNSSLLRAAVEAAPEGVEVELWEGIGDLPLFDQDLEAGDEPAPSVGSVPTGRPRTRFSSPPPSTTARSRAG